MLIEPKHQSWSPRVSDATSGINSWTFIDSIQPLIRYFQYILLFNRTKSHWNIAHAIHFIWLSDRSFRSTWKRILCNPAMSTRTNFPSVHSFINFDATKIIILLIFNTKSINRVRNVLINRYYFVNREHCNRMWFAYTLSADTAHAHRSLILNEATLIDW